MDKKLFIVGLDMATETGWAYLHPTRYGGSFHKGSMDFKLKRGESQGVKFLLFQNWLARFFRVYIGDVPDDHRVVVCFEKPHHRGGAATEILVGMRGILLTYCQDNRIETVEVPPNTLKKFATGRGNASKADMIADLEAKHSIKTDNDNIADAAWLVYYGRDMFGEE